ncbi:MAG TPA: RNA-binding cell elongation regulator Jag/EloR [Gaiellaceae bacterium]|jgi:spoIIIJ-associated protein
MSVEGGAPASCEATGETVGEAKWAALRELERRYPGLDKESVQFTVVSEGERGLLGVGHVPAKVVATVLDLPEAPPPVEAPAGEEPDADSPAGRLQRFLERVCSALDLPAHVTVSERDDEILATLAGGDLGIAIGKRGQTLDAIQYLAHTVVYRPGSDEERKPIVVDAAGYRSRRQAALERTAERAARDAIRSDSPVELEPMNAVERKIVHLFLQDLGGVETTSEGTEPNRYIVVRPLPH